MINVAIIGLGVMGLNHYRILKGLGSRVNICALCDAVDMKHFKEPFYTHVDALLDETRPDAVFIATPTFLHKDIALKCIDRNVNLFIEKPVAATVEEACDIASAIRTRGVKCSVGYVERFNPVVQALKQELRNKEIYSLSITRVGPFPPRIGDVGVLTDLSVHDIDLVRFITHRKILKTSIFKSRKIINHDEDNAVLSFELEGNTLAEITTNWLTPFKKRTIEVACRDAYYEADLILQTLNRYSGFDEDNSYVVRQFHIKKDEPLLKEVEAYLDYLEDGGKPGSLASVEDSLFTLEIATQ